MNYSYSQKKPVQDWGRIRIKRALEDAGWSMRQLSKHHNYFPTAVSNAINTPWISVEKIIAAEIGVSVEEIWPSRWCNGERIASASRQSNPKQGVGKDGI